MDQAFDTWTGVGFAFGLPHILAIPCLLDVELTQAPLQESLEPYGLKWISSKIMMTNK